MFGILGVLCNAVYSAGLVDCFVARCLPTVWFVAEF